MTARAICRLLIWLLPFMPTATIAEAGERIALLIGNSDYQTDDLDLANPVNDARALEEALDAIGFETVVHFNLDAAQMRTATARFGARARAAETALFFFAGHGLQFSGDNMLIGTDLVTADAAGLRAASLSMREVKAALEAAAPGAGLILLDACRDAPIRDDGMPQGLVRTGGGAGLLVAYATDPGNVAYDGEGENSVFTRALLEHLASPGLDVRLMLGRVRQQVVLDTFGQQVPWVEEALIGEHRLVPDVPPDEVEVAEHSELALWRAAAERAEPSGYRSYLDTYPDGTFAPLARARLRAIEGQVSTLATRHWRDEDPHLLRAALAALGYLPANPSPQDSIDRAVAAFVAGSSADARPETLYNMARQSVTSLAAATAQQLRTDLVALRSVDRLLKVSKQTLAEIEELASRNPDGGAILSQARRDYEGIARARRIILLRLDQSRTYYADLIALARRLLPEAAGTMPEPTAATDTTGIDQRVRKDAQLFLKHVADADPQKEGSYSWLADFLRQS